jgi:uncharacterized membrane protein
VTGRFLNTTVFAVALFIFIVSALWGGWAVYVCNSKAAYSICERDAMEIDSSCKTPGINGIYGLY